MSSVNKVILIGNLGRDPETRTFPSGDQICTVSIATTDKWKDKQSGEMREATEWHNLTFNGRLAEIAAEYLHKGSQIYVEGSLRTRKWEKDGVTHYQTGIRVDSMQMLGGKPRNEGDGYGQSSGYSRAPAPQQQRAAAPAARNSYADQRGRAAPAPARTGGGSGFDDMEDDIPFVTASFEADAITSKAKRMARYDY